MSEHPSNLRLLYQEGTSIILSEYSIINYIKRIDGGLEDQRQAGRYTVTMDINN